MAASGIAEVPPALANSDPIDVRYFNSLFIFENELLHESTWHPGEIGYIPRWEYASSVPVTFTATFDRPLDLSTPGGTIPPASVEEGTDAFTYTWEPATHIRAFLEERLVADSGLLLRRVVDPMILPPGITHVTIDASVEIVRSPSVNGMSVPPIGGEFQVLLGESHLLPGARSFGPAGGKPIEVLSSEGFSGNLILEPPFDVGRSFALHIEVQMLNPNDFEVFFVPSVDAVLDIDASPFGVETPGGSLLATSIIGFDVSGIAGEQATFSFEHPEGIETDWAFGGFAGFGGFRGIWHRWQERVEAVPFVVGEVVLSGLRQPLIHDIDDKGRIYFTEVKVSPEGFAGVLKRYDPRRDSVEVLVSHNGLFIANVATNPRGNLYYRTDEVAGCFEGSCFLNRLKRGEVEPEVLYVATTTRIADLAVDKEGNLYFTEEIRKFVDGGLVISSPSKLFFVPHDSGEAVQLLELEGIAPQPLLVHPNPRVGVLFAANLDDCVCILQFRDGVVDRVLERSPDQFGALAYMALGRDGSLYYLYRQRSDIIPPVELPMFGYLEVGRLDLPSLLGGGDPGILVADTFDEALLVYYGGLPWLGASASDEIFFTILFFRENWVAGDWTESLFRLDISTGTYEPIASSFGMSEGLTLVVDARGNVYYAMFASGVIVRA